MTGYVKIDVTDLGEHHAFAVETRLHGVGDAEKAALVDCMLNALEVEDSDISAIFFAVTMARLRKRDNKEEV